MHTEFSKAQSSQLCVFVSAPAPPYVSAPILFLCLLPQSDGESAAPDAQKKFSFIYSHKAAAEAFCILALRVSLPCGAAQCLFTVFFCALLLLLLLWLCVSFSNF